MGAVAPRSGAHVRSGVEVQTEAPGELVPGGTAVAEPLEAVHAAGPAQRSRLDDGLSGTGFLTDSATDFLL